MGVVNETYLFAITEQRPSLEDALLLIQTLIEGPGGGWGPMAMPAEVWPSGELLFPAYDRERSTIDDLTALNQACERYWSGGVHIELAGLRAEPDGFDDDPYSDCEVSLFFPPRVYERTFRDDAYLDEEDIQEIRDQRGDPSWEPVTTVGPSFVVLRIVGKTAPDASEVKHTKLWLILHLVLPKWECETMLS